MIYLDYTATTPVSLEVMDTISKVTKDFIGNPNSLNALGVAASELLQTATNQVADIMSCSSEEIIFTSGATESNNLALIGVMNANYKKGKHLITSKLEHPSIYAICNYLKSLGYEISYVDNNEDGLIDFDKLKSLIRPDTALVSICAVNSELGVRQPLKMIKQIIKKENPNTLFHSDITQALGKYQLNTIDFDLASASSHKIFGPKGIGLLYKRGPVKLMPLEYGSGKSKNIIKPGTPPLPLIAGFSKAIRTSQNDMEKRNTYIDRLNTKLLNEFSNYPTIQINSTKNSIPQIINISISDIKPETFIRAMDKREVYLSTNTACASGEPSSAILALYKDRRRANTSIRISLSHQTTLDEINKFIKHFSEVYEELKNTNNE